MIQIYQPSNTNFEKNGDAIQCTVCVASFILNSVWSLHLEAPYNDKIIENAVVGVSTPYGKKQLYRIYSVLKDDEYVIADALPIFMDAKNDCFLYDVRPTNKTGQDALNLMITNPKYKGKSDISKASTSYFIQKNLIEAINGDDENSFLKRWGGEVSYNNFEISINERLGSDNGARAEFGYNLTGIKENIDMSDVITRIVPKAYNGYVLPDEETVDSPLIGNYPIVYTKVIEYEDIKLIDDAQEDDISNGYTVCDTLEELYDSLRNRAKEEYKNDADKPKITYEVNIVDLSKTDEYQNYKNLVKLQLGDDVLCRHKRLNIETKARVIELEYDCLYQTVNELKLGDFESNYFDGISSIVSSAGKVINTSNNTLMADRIKGIINLLNTSMRAQKNIAEKQDVRAILFEDLDPNSPTFGAMCIGTQGIQIAKKRNETDSDWEWGTAIDFQAIYADYIIAGILSDKLGNNYWNLDTGDFQLTSSAKIDEKTVKDYVDDISNDAVTTYDKSLTHQQIFNRLTNNGQLQGIYQKNGLLYINAEYIDAETLSAISANLGAITGGSLNINNKFIVNANGVLTAKGATIDGTITATKGNIGGFDINNTGFTKTTVTTLKKTYTSADVTRVENIIKGSVTPTTSDYNYYDINNSGTITALDLIWIEKILVPCGGNILYTDVIINSYPFDTNDINKPMMTVRYRGTNGTTICESSISARTLSTLIINANSITANTLSVKYGDTLNDFGNKTQFTCYNDDSSVGGIIYAEYFSGTPNFYILAENGGYLTLGTLGSRWYFQDVDDTNWKSAFYPRYTGSALGKSGKPWYRLYAENSTTVTSDRRVKCDFRNMDERYIEFVEYLMPQLYHRIGHENLPLESGFVAQDVEEAMIKAGISNDELGLVEHYVNEKEGIDRYSLVYEGFISILLYYIQKKNMSYEERFKKLEEAILNGNGNN